MRESEVSTTWDGNYPLREKKKRREKKKKEKGKEKGEKEVKKTRRKRKGKKYHVLIFSPGGGLTTVVSFFKSGKTSGNFTPCRITFVAD